MKEAAKRIGQALPPGLRSWLQYQSGHHSFFYPWGSAMNGQAARLEIVRGIISGMRPVKIIETGTYRGITTEWFAGFGVPVVSVEAVDGPYLFSLRRLARFPHVSVVKGSSDLVVAAMPPETGPVFVYLDAHWEKMLPLRAELQAISRLMPRAVIAIDDFQVPEDPGYGYDDYGADAALDIGYLERSSLPTAMRLFFPRVPGREETGARRGCAFLTADPEFIGLLEGMTSLRSWPLGQG